MQETNEFTKLLINQITDYLNNYLNSLKKFKDSNEENCFRPRTELILIFQDLKAIINQKKIATKIPKVLQYTWKESDSMSCENMEILIIKEIEAINLINSINSTTVNNYVDELWKRLIG